MESESVIDVAEAVVSDFIQKMRKMCITTVNGALGAFNHTKNPLFLDHAKIYLKEGEGWSDLVVDELIAVVTE